MSTIGKQAPSFSLPDQDGKIRTLQEFVGKWIILYFYPKDNTPGCSIEGREFTQIQASFPGVIIGISADSVESHCSFIDKKQLNLILLSDQGKKTIKEYGVWGPKKFMGREFLGIKRTTFLIDQKGTVVALWENVKAKGHAQAVFEKWQSLQ